MGSSTHAVMNSNISEFKKALAKVEQKRGKGYFLIEQGGFENLSKEKGIFIGIPSKRRQFFVACYPIEIDNIKKELPKSSRKLKNAKNIIFLSMGQGDFAIDLFTEILQSHPSNGYLRPNDCGLGGRYLEVGTKGLLKGNLSKLGHGEQIISLYYNDLMYQSDRFIDFIKSEDLSKLNLEDIKTVYYSLTKAHKDGDVSCTDYYSDMIIIFKDKTRKPIVVEDTSHYVVIGGRHIQGMGTSSKFIESVPKGKLKNLSNKEYTDVFAIN